MSTMRVIFSSFFDPPKTYPIKELFRQIDLDNDGYVSKEDVKAFLLKFDIKITKYNIDILADGFMNSCGVPPDGLVSQKQFFKYVVEQDTRLSPIYAQLDRKLEGRLDLVDIQTYFLKLGIPIELAEAKRLLKRMNKTDAQEIEYSEWRKFLLFQPICDLESIAHYWRNGCVIDLSSDPVITIPQILKKDNDHSRDVIQLVAGGVAGVVSRTCTAPIDRLKIMRQVYGYKHKRSGFLEGKLTSPTFCFFFKHDNSVLLNIILL
uniref:Calcium-binding mitochondrial carrier protein SCaMC-3 n=2 Tax=Schistocephalus solidus TaxID=70667 RepID=A0A0X3PS71_SCHSO